ncbi:Ribonuclease H-like superfamily [Arabidopsis suecica]|uniref:Ribonuclease H-like superfamily n=1 Tax=Arabidopsis suecica TaxID=45249 RepID=A0A8T2HAY4_ARASU|nr:Ribonuclease H-like superfamily [Arabidopsis suecica]
MGFNCDFIDKSATCEAGHHEFWNEIGVGTSEGPLFTKLECVMDISKEWSYEKRLMVDATKGKKKKVAIMPKKASKIPKKKMAKVKEMKVSTPKVLKKTMRRDDDYVGDVTKKVVADTLKMACSFEDTFSNPHVQRASEAMAIVLSSIEGQIKNLNDGKSIVKRIITDGAPSPSIPEHLQPVSDEKLHSLMDWLGLDEFERFERGQGKFICMCGSLKHDANECALTFEEDNPAHDDEGSDDNHQEHEHGEQDMTGDGSLPSIDPATLIPDTDLTTDRLRYLHAKYVCESLMDQREAGLLEEFSDNVMNEYAFVKRKRLSFERLYNQAEATEESVVLRHIRKKDKKLGFATSGSSPMTLIGGAGGPVEYHHHHSLDLSLYQHGRVTPSSFTRPITRPITLPTSRVTPSSFTRPITRPTTLPHGRVHSSPSLDHSTTEPSTIICITRLNTRLPASKSSSFRTQPDTRAQERKEDSSLSLDLSLDPILHNMEDLDWESKIAAEEEMMMDDDDDIDSTHEQSSETPEDYSYYTRNTEATDVVKTWDSEKNKLKMDLANIQSRICLAFDCWTAIAGEGYITLTAHYVDESWTLNSKILSFCDIPPPHTGDALATKIHECLKEWRIEENIFTLTLDNASANDTMQEILKERLNLDDNLLCGEYVAGVEEFLTFANSQRIVQSCREDPYVDVGNVVEDQYVDMVNDAFRYNVGFDDNYHQDGTNQNVEEPVRNHSKKFYDLLEGAQNPLYDGCREGQSQLSLAARVMQNKADHNMSERCVDSRWKPMDDYRRRTKVPYSRMWYLPIGDRLKRMYLSHKTAAVMRWHAEHQSKEEEMNHPSDAAEWRYFQELHPMFAEEPRNVYLRLCTDGFNPFGMSRNHSLWLVILTPYNLPPGMCMNTEYLFLTILNHGPNHPRGSLDVFLQPLIEELKELWSTGIDAYDVSLNQNFNLKAVLLWTISDFLAYNMLSGSTTHGKDASTEYPPESLTGEQIYYERLSGVNPPRTKDVGGNGHEKKMSGYGKEHNWHKESILWELPYWKDLNLRHCINKTHHWDPLITWTVQFYFNEICLRRMKGMEEQLGKTVNIGDVFIKTHTKPDGTYVDRKAEKIAELYQKNLQLRQSEFEAEASAVSDGTSRVRELTAEDCTTIFLQSTERDSRGVPYGVGSLKESLVNGKRKQAGDSTSFVALQEQLLEAQRKIEEQVSYNHRRESKIALREAENSRTADEQKKKLEHLSLVEKFLRENDPRFLNFLESHSAKETTIDPISPSPAASPSSSAS